MTALKFFLFGLLAAAGALVVELILSALISILLHIDIATRYFETFTFSLLIIILIEEIFKFSLLRQLFSTLKTAAARISLALLFGGGFAFLEIFAKILSLPQPTLSAVFSFGFLGVLLIHVLTAGVLGSFLTHQKDLSLSLVLLVILLASLLHLGYNLLVIYSQGTPLISTYLLGAFLLLYGLKYKLAK